MPSSTCAAAPARLVAALHDAVVDRPRFTITAIAVPDVSDDLAEQIRVAAFVSLPVSSLELDVGAVRERVEALGSVERARVRALASGVLEIRAIERVPVVVWRSGRAASSSTSTACASPRSTAACAAPTCR